MLQRLTFNIGGGKVRYETLEGRRHMVVPAASLEEGVWSGSSGPIFYPGDEIGKSVPTWNHKPLVVYHPQDSDGQPISACDPSVLNTRKVGVILNAKFSKKLTHEAWIDVERCQEVDARVLQCLQAKKPVEVSTGVSLHGEEVKNEDGSFPKYKDKEYQYRASNLVGDHLAVLPDKLGAYGIKDGGGLLVNERFDPECIQLVARRTVENALKRVGAEVADNELSFDQTTMQVRELLAAKYGEPGKYWDGYVQEMYSDYCVFCNDYKSGYMLQKFTVKDSEVTLDGDAVEVQRSVEYKPVGNEAGVYTVDQEGRLALKPEEKTTMAFDKKAHLASLIGNGWEESDRAFLDALPDDRLEKIKPAPKTTTVTATNAGVTVVANGDGKDTQTTVVKKEEDRKITLNDLTDPVEREMVSEWRAACESERGRLVDAITANKNNPFTKEYLQAKPLNELRGLAVLAKGHEKPSNGQPAMFNNNYAGAAGTPPVVGNAEFEVLPLPSYEEPAKK